MRILGVRFKNLNSLAGEWQIDFTHPAYASDGIFAITGPTGSGKTTLLDAICLGLYGRTPRLELVTKNGNEIMSRQTGDCFAEVTFETQKGRYRCQWSQHRARKRPDGELQQARREISDAVSGKILETKMIQVEAFIEKVTGMDFERFTRSMLLAQGGFAAFLQASPDGRAPILEQITGTGIYSLISIKVHERRREEQEKLELLQAEFQGIQVLSVEDEDELRVKLKEKQALDAELGGRVEVLRRAVLWLAGIAGLGKDISELDVQEQAFEERKRVFASDAHKLERARKAVVLEGAYRGIVSLRTQQAADVRELENAAAALPGKEKAGTDAFAAKQSAEAALDDARKKQAEAGEVIKQVREHDARLSEQKKQLAEKDKTLAAANRQLSEYRFRLEDNTKVLKTAEKELDAVHEHLQTYAADAALPTHLAAIAKGLETLRQLERRRILIAKALKEAAKKKETEEAAGKKAQADHEQCRRKLEAGQTEQKRLTAELAAILQGREIGHWRELYDNLKERERFLIQAGEALERIDRTRKELEYLKIAVETLKATQEKINSEIKSGSVGKEHLEKEIAGLEAQVLLLARIRDMEAERRCLEDGKACPLCGATDHPYARGNVPDLNSAENALKKAKADFKKISEAQNRMEAILAETSAEIRHKVNEVALRKAAQEADEKALSDMPAKLNIATDLQIRAGIVHEETAVVQGKIADIVKVVAAAEELGKKEKTVQTAVEIMRSECDLAVSAFQEIRVKIEAASVEYAQLNKDSDALAADTENARIAALQDIEPFGVSRLALQDVDAVLQDLTARHDAWQFKQNEKNAGEKRIASLHAEISQVQALLGNLEKDMTARCAERHALIEACTVQSSAREALFGDKNPDEEEKRLIAIVDQANRAAEKGREVCGRLDQEIAGLKEKKAVLTARTEKRAQELAESLRQLADRWGQAGFADETDYVSACLSEDEREKLANREKELIREKTQLETRRKDKTALLAIEREKHLTEQSMTQIQESVAACDSEIKQVRLDIGGIAQRLSQNENQTKNRQERLQAIEARKKECARWNALHGLIGSADGKKFRNFAQGLTFEMMTAQANRQLRKMTDRYLLIRDASEPLELNVIDNYQAGEIRSTKNLSGGESFIVSLALALGLSRMSSRNVRVDSLFLDEGFGTLDDDALEMALETLAGLQRDGKLIGVISHVPALKDRIGTQIAVTPGTAGRSSLSGPGCRRI